MYFQFDFEIGHKGGSGGEYAAMAFSDDDSMGDDLVFACVGGQGRKKTAKLIGFGLSKSRQICKIIVKF